MQFWWALSRSRSETRWCRQSAFAVQLRHDSWHTGHTGCTKECSLQQMGWPLTFIGGASQQITDDCIKYCKRTKSVHIPYPTRLANCQCSQVLDPIHRTPGSVTFSQLVQIGHFNFTWIPGRIKNTNMRSCSSTKYNPTTLIEI